MALTETATEKSVKSETKSESSKDIKLDRKEKPLTKVIIRRLPPSISKEDFVQQVSPLADYDYLYIVKGDLSMGENAYSRVYINFCNAEDIFIFKEKFDNYVFVDEKGHEYPAIVEYAPFQKIPKKRRARPDPKIGSIESDPVYQEFLESLTEQPEQVEKPEYSYQFASDAKSKSDLSTPLLDFIKQRKLDKIRIREEKREERRKRDLERKRMREEERKRREEKMQARILAQKSKIKERQSEKDKDNIKRVDTEAEDTSEVKGENVPLHEDENKVNIDQLDETLKDQQVDPLKEQLEDTDLPKIHEKTEVADTKEIKQEMADKKTSGVKERDRIIQEKTFRNRDRRYDERKSYSRNKSSKYSAGRDRYEEKREYRSKRDEHRDRDRDRNRDRNRQPAKSVEEPKQIIIESREKKVKKYSERREERRIEAKKAEQNKDAGIIQIDKLLTRDGAEIIVQKYPSESTAATSSTSRDERQFVSQKSDDRSDEAENESRNRNKENDPRSQRRIKNKDRPSLTLYKPGMLKKKPYDVDKTLAGDRDDTENRSEE